MIAHILITSLICFGVYKTTRYKFYPVEQEEVSEVFGFVKKYGDIYLPYWLRKPLYDCPPCMASVWSIVSSWYFGLESIGDIVPLALAVCGLNYILLRLFPYTDD